MVFGLSLGHCQAVQGQGRNCSSRGSEGLFWGSQPKEDWYEVWWEDSLSNACPIPALGLAGEPLGETGLGSMEQEGALLRAALETGVTVLPRL